MGRITGYSFFPLACLGLWGQSAGAQVLPADLQIRMPSDLPTFASSLFANSLSSNSLSSDSLSSDSFSESPLLRPQLSSSFIGDSLALDFSVCDATYQCLNGQISTEYLTPSGQEKFQQHRLGGAPITLAPDVQGFLLSPDSSSLSSSSLGSSSLDAAIVSDSRTSVMWQQDEQFYTVYLPATKRQEALYLAHSVVNSAPVTQQSLQAIIEQDTIVQDTIVQGTRENQVALAGAIAEDIPVNILPDIRQSTQPLSELAETFPVESLQIDAVEVSPDLHLAADIETLITPLSNQSVTSEELSLVANTISQQYQSQGFLTSGAVVAVADTATRDLTDSNTLTIGREASADIIVREDVITPAEVSVSDVDENPLVPGAARYIQARLGLALQADEPVHFDRLEDQLRLLREDPLFENVEANLTSLSSSSDGQPRLAVRATQAEPFAMGIRLDNSSPISTGGEQATVGLSQRNFFRFGDQFSSSYNISSTAGIRKYAFDYQVPLNSMNGSLRIGVNSTTSKVTQAPFDALGIRGNSRQYSVSVRQPLVRSPREEFALSFGVSHTSGQTFLFNDLAQPFGLGPDLDGRSQVSTLTFGQQYLSRDAEGAWSFNSEFNLGVDWLGATVNEAPVPDGRFFSWLGQVQRSQRAGDNHLFVMQADVQLTPDSLLPSEQFVVGGVGSVRGYRQNLRSGDSGFRLSVEDRVAVARDSAGRPDVFITPFLEAARVWQSGENPNPLPEKTLLLGTGVGLLWENAFKLPDLNLRVDYGLPLIQVNNRGRNLQDSAIHFSVDYEI